MAQLGTAPVLKTGSRKGFPVQIRVAASNGCASRVPITPNIFNTRPLTLRASTADAYRGIRAATYPLLF